MIIITKRTSAELNPPDSNSAALFLDAAGNPAIELPSGEQLQIGVLTDTNGSGNKYKVNITAGALVLTPHA